MGDFSGIVQQQSSDRRSITFPWGFRGISQELPTTIKLIKVTDNNGVPLANAKVVVQNTGGDLTSYTDSTGLAEIVPDVGQTVNILVSQYKTTRAAVSYTTDTEPYVKTITLDTVIPKVVPNRRTVNQLPTSFIFTINTENLSTGSTPTSQFKLPLVSNGSYDFNVDWGDGIVENITSWNQLETTHSYLNPGTYEISIAGTIVGWKFAGIGDRLKILDISNWGSLRFTTTDSQAFRSCTNLDVTAQDAAVLNGSCSNFFEFCSNLVGTPAFNTWDTSAVTSMNAMFRQCPLFNQPIGNWDVSNVTVFGGNNSGMFTSCVNFNQPLGNWNVSNGVSFEEMFYLCSNFDQDLSNWNLASAITLTQLFDGCTAFNNGGSPNINNWNVSTVQSFNNMFLRCSNFNQPLGNWNVGNGQNFSLMFQEATSFDQDLSNWNMSSATNVSAMFRLMNFNNAGNPNIANWNVSNVVAFGGNNAGMFSSNSTFNQPIGAWDVSSGIIFEEMFFGATAFNQDLSNWTFKTTGTINFSEMFRSATNFNNGGSPNINNWNTERVTNMQFMFNNATSFNQPLGNWNVSNVTTFALMFQQATSFDQNIGSWNMSSAITLTAMFRLSNFNNGGSPSINNWNVSNVTGFGTNSGGMFGSNPVFNQPIGNWDVSKGTNFEEMFASATAFNQDISGWNFATTGTISFSEMFQGATNFNNGGNPNINNWNVDRVTNMFRMFQSATAFDQPLGNWDIRNVTSLGDFMRFKTDANYSALNLDNIYNGWSALSGLTAKIVDFGTIKYTSAGQAGRDILTGTYGWTITDGGQV